MGHHLPLLLRGLYLESLCPVKLVVPQADCEKFLSAIRRQAPNVSFDAAEVATAMLTMLADRLEQNVCQQIFDALPEEILEFRSRRFGSPAS